MNPQVQDSLFIALDVNTTEDLGEDVYKRQSWVIFLQYNKNAVIANNNIHDQYTTGLINFGSATSIIANNTVTNAVNHGIDVRHGTGPVSYTHLHTNRMENL